jgi:glycosyltransferase involved in cell wall biosynthesis
MFSIITCTLDAENRLLGLAESLQAQSSAEFCWIIQASNGHAKVPFDASKIGREVVLSRSADVGLYDGLNKALSQCSTSHYLVLGDDDRLEPDAVQKINHILLRTPDNVDECFFCFSIYAGLRILNPSRRSTFLYGMSALTSSHSVGTLIPLSAHNTVGLYDTTSKICADQELLLRAHDAGYRFCRRPDVLVGTYSLDGISSIPSYRHYFEFFLVQSRVSSRKKLQLFLYIMRLVKLLLARGPVSLR